MLMIGVEADGPPSDEAALLEVASGSGVDTVLVDAVARADVEAAAVPREGDAAHVGLLLLMGDAHELPGAVHARVDDVDGGVVLGERQEVDGGGRGAELDGPEG